MQLHIQAAKVLGMLALMMVVGCSDGNVFSLTAGTCFDDVEQFSDGEGEVDSVPIVDCDDPHANEVFATFDVGGDSYPGRAEVSDVAADGCLDRFEPYVGRDYETSRYYFTSMTPTSESWDRGDREVVCLLFDGEFADLEGSAKGSGE